MKNIISNIKLNSIPLSKPSLEASDFIWKTVVCIFACKSVIEMTKGIINDVMKNDYNVDINVGENISFSLHKEAKKDKN